MVWCKRQSLTILQQGFATRKAVATAATSTLTRSWKNETKKNSIFSEFIRRNASTLAPLKSEEKKQKEIMEEVSFQSKSLYLCFEEYPNYTTNAHVIQSIRLSHLLAPPEHGGDDLKLQEVAYRSGPKTIVPKLMCTGVVGSKVIFFGGIVSKDSTTPYILPYSPSKEVCLFETNPSIDPNPSLQPSQMFKITWPEYVLTEVDNKLYRFEFNDRFDVCESFEVFEPLQDEWLLLDAPPLKFPYGFNHAIAGTKVLVWARNQTRVYMFDVTYPAKGWTELDPCVGSYIPSINAYEQLFVKLKSGYGEGFLMFSINLKEIDKVLVSHMSHACDSLKILKPLHLQLPEVWHPKSYGPSRCELFHLGGLKVGIVFSCDQLHNYDYEIFDDDCDVPPHDDDYFVPPHDDDEDNEGKKDDDHNNDDNGGRDNVNNDDLDDNNKTRVLVMIFECEIVEESMDIKYRLLSSRSLEYSIKNTGEESRTDCSVLFGAYVL